MTLAITSELVYVCGSGFSALCLAGTEYRCLSGRERDRRAQELEPLGWYPPAMAIPNAVMSGFVAMSKSKPANPAALSARSCQPRFSNENARAPSTARSKPAAMA